VFNRFERFTVSTSPRLCWGYLTDEKRFYPIYEKLIIIRNRNMVSKIENYLQSKGTYFVVVGAGHLIGSKGIVQLLKDRGYSVEQL